MFREVEKVPERLKGVVRRNEKRYTEETQTESELSVGELLTGLIPVLYVSIRSIVVGQFKDTGKSTSL